MASEVIIDPTFKFEACATPEMEKLVTETMQIAYNFVYKNVPKRGPGPASGGTFPHKGSYAAGLEINKTLRGYGWEAELRVRAVNWHFVEYGFRDRAGREHEGLHLLEKGLKTAAAQMRGRSS
jgi:hypothetical protein